MHEDIKPYLPFFESINASVPEWVQNSYDEPMMQVSWSEAALQQLSQLESSSLGLFESRDEMKEALEETLALDIRSPLQKQRHPAKRLVSGHLWPSKGRLEELSTCMCRADLLESIESSIQIPSQHHAVVERRQGDRERSSSKGTCTSRSSW